MPLPDPNDLDAACTPTIWMKPMQHGSSRSAPVGIFPYGSNISTMKSVALSVALG